MNKKNLHMVDTLVKFKVQFTLKCMDIKTHDTHKQQAGAVFNKISGISNKTHSGLISMLQELLDQILANKVWKDC